ncbi:MAG: GNAT family N-acetyltransferase [Spirochaetes bacterium]|nr:GNAT family N-acetyltransferase [Spirochaetota bacterium]MBU1079852.1 GNAT family N-acetyltransferase [Spirochaetota bacterium]
MDVTVRSARRGDAGRLAELSGQLGYPCAGSDVEARMGPYLESDDEAILVAEAAGRVVGWLSLAAVRHFYVEPFVEVSGFVVDEEARSAGIGRRMMGAAEDWTRARGLQALRLKTNVTRVRAHSFYERLGFERSKEQIVYLKRLER